MESNQLSTLFKSELMGFFLDQTALNASHYGHSLGRDKLVVESQSPDAPCFGLFHLCGIDFALRLPGEVRAVCAKSRGHSDKLARLAFSSSRVKAHSSY